MAADDLNSPLKRKTRPPRKGRLGVFVYAPIALAFGALVTGLVWTALVDDPDGGRAVAVAHLGEDAPATTGSIGDPIAAARARALQAPGWRMGGEGAASGIAGEGENASAAPDPAEPQTDFQRMQAMLQQAPRQAGGATSGPLPELLEASAHGPLPRIGEDGTLPRQAYARAASLAPDRPNIAIIVGGLGLSQTGTQRAVRDLDPAVTLAFAPTGASLKRWAEMARDEGHELLIQAPMEPFGYPSVNPGERTLLVSAEGGRNADNLAWILSRIGAYTGVMNYLGGRFSAEDEAMRSLLAHLGERGLFYVDDGSAEESVAARIGASLGTPVVTADRRLDQARSAGEVEKALNELEIFARRNGRVVAVAPAFPSTVAAIAAWMPGARARGVEFVPVSALAEERK
ncbi:divergent polysaccharide deacetylase family protein [Afifella pfennigii]|uniref:divergent polysaccharide deacetylase family protein n=1 Tax=Afifella pfennigii TaxID=209897 RepID=UPI00054E4025|nr:divergent polysaccharide deacetylase family protein [Afifella pfennigii]